MKWYNSEAWISTIVTIIVGFLIVFLLGGCKSKEYIKVPEYHTEYVNRTDTFHKLDSVYLKDSVFMYQKGDTIYHTKVTFRDRYHNIYKVKLDTIIKQDSVFVPYPVQRTLTKNEQRLMDIGRASIIWLVCLALLIVLACLLIYYDHNRNKKC